MTNDDFLFNQRQMRGWISRHLMGSMRFDSVTPLSYAVRKNGSFASPPHDGFAFVVDATVLRYSRTVKVSFITDNLCRISREIVMHGTLDAVISAMERQGFESRRLGAN